MTLSAPPRLPLRPSPREFAWAVPQALLAIGLVGWKLAGLVPASAASGILATLALVLGAALALFSDMLKLAFDEALGRPLRRLVSTEAILASRGVRRRALVMLRGVPRAVRDLAALALVTAVATLALEIAWNADALSIAPEFRNTELMFVGLMLLALYFATLRRGVGPALGVVACAACGLAQYFVASFKGTAILPSDLLSLGTALSVSGGYAYELKDSAVSCLSLASVALGLCSLIGRPPASTSQGSAADASRPSLTRASVPRHLARTGIRIGASLACSALCLHALATGPASTRHQERLGAQIDGWNALSSYAAQGFVPGFLAALQDMGIPMPEGYSEEMAVALQDAYAARYGYVRGDTAEHVSASSQFERETPSIVVVMNETFSDLSFMDDLGVGYEGPAAFNAVDDALVRGKLAVSAYGGGTCNSEFEFLTGNSLAYIGAGKYPYTLYDLSHCDNLAAQLGQLGYETTAIHPNLGSNWSRSDVYASFGFDCFLTIDDFGDAPTFHSGVTDRATYERVLDQLRSSDDPQFVFDVTMQGHSGYDQHNVDEGLLRGYEPSYLDAKDAGQLDEYLACIDQADADLAWLMDELRALDRPVVLVFFGDHQPGFSHKLNDALHPDEGEPRHGARTYQTDYLVWANYHVAGTDGARYEAASSSTLAAVALDAVGAPLSGFQAAQLGIRQDMPMLNLFSYQDANGTWHGTRMPETADETLASQSAGGDGAPLDDGAVADAVSRSREAFDALASIQYANFATKVL